MNNTSETLAILAAHLLRGDDYRGAAKKAYALLKAVDEEIKWQAEFQKQLLADQLPAEITDMEFQKGIKFITEQTRKDRAEEGFSLFMEKSTSGKAEATAAITRYEKNGFTALEVDALRKQYQRFKKKSL